jgi:hypothetical protein
LSDTNSVYIRLKLVEAFTKRAFFTMSGVLKIEITESEETLKTLVHHQSSARHKERLQMLYWLKKGQVTTRLELSNLLGRGESTIYRFVHTLGQRLDRGYCQGKHWQHQQR